MTSLNAENESRWIDGHKVYFVRDNVVAADMFDKTATYLGYDPECPACWINRSHTTRYHDGIKEFHMAVRDNKKSCVECGADLQGPKIPEERRRFYGGSTHFSRVIGVEIPGVYDGVLFWMCPDCGHRWHRFEETNSYLRDRAVEYVENGKEI